MRSLLLIGVAFGVVLAACGGGDSGATTPTAAIVPTKKAVTAIADAGVVLTTAEPYHYTYVSMGKRDPFRSAGTAEPVAPGATNTAENPCDEPLCQVDLDELRLVAVVSGDANPVAMVEDRTGVGHVIRRNTKIGRQAGKVTAILKDCIVVTSFVTGTDGRTQPNRQNLCVSTEGQGTNPVLDLMNGKTRE